MDKSEKGRILLIAGDGTCYNVLNEFAKDIAIEFENKGFDAEVRYITTLNEDLLSELNGNDYRAILGFQTNLFTLKDFNGTYIGSRLSVPLYNFILDSPATRLHYFAGDIKNLTILYHDSDYISFVRKHFTQCRVLFLPPGGKSVAISNESSFFSGREYDCTFMGTYTDYRKLLNEGVSTNPEYADLILDYFQFLISNPWYSHEKGTEVFLSGLNVVLSEEEFLSVYRLLYFSVRAALAFYREKNIKIFLDSGIKIDAFSRSWESAPYSDHSNLIIHDEVPYSECADYYAKSKLSLNIFSWHKASITERIANIMLNGAVCISDRSSGLFDHFSNGKDLVTFDLEKGTDIIEAIKKLLSDDEYRISIAKQGYQNALMHHTWGDRVDKIIELM